MNQLIHQVGTNHMTKEIFFRDEICTYDKILYLTASYI